MKNIKILVLMLLSGTTGCTEQKNSFFGEWKGHSFLDGFEDLRKIEINLHAGEKNIEGIATIYPCSHEQQCNECVFSISGFSGVVNNNGKLPNNYFTSIWTPDNCSGITDPVVINCVLAQNDNNKLFCSPPSSKIIMEYERRQIN